jgi:predicted Rossmann fold flavoprotein
MAAAFAAAGGAETLLLESTRDGGRKILISGGGRCNILPARVDERRFVTDSSPHTLRNILRSWPLAEQIGFFERELGLPLVEETETGKLFPASNRARDVRDGLLALATRRGARFLASTPVTGLAPQGRDWRIERDGAEPLTVDAVVVATGGLSVPNTGSDGRGLAMLAALGHTVHPTYPALTPVVSGPTPFTALPAGAPRAAVGSCSPTAGTAVRRCSTSPTSSYAPVWKVTAAHGSPCGGPVSTRRRGSPPSSRTALVRLEGSSGPSYPTGWPTCWPRRPA